MIEEMELIIYSNENNFSIDISPTQAYIIMKALGLKFNKDGTYSEFSTNTLEKFILPKLNFKEIE